MTPFATLKLTRSRIVDSDIPFAGDPAYETLDGPASIACSRADGTIFDILVIASIPVIVTLHLLAWPQAGDGKSLGRSSLAAEVSMTARIPIEIDKHR